MQSKCGRSSRVALQACAYVPCDTLYNPLSCSHPVAMLCACSSRSPRPTEDCCLGLVSTAGASVFISGASVLTVVSEMQVQSTSRISINAWSHMLPDVQSEAVSSCFLHCCHSTAIVNKHSFCGNALRGTNTCATEHSFRHALPASPL